MPVTRTPKKLAQTALSTTVTARYTAPAATVTQITEIWLANTNTTTVRMVTLRAHGTGTGNTLADRIEIPARSTVIIDGCKIVLSASEVLAASQDVGTDAILTAYGIEEVTS